MKLPTIVQLAKAHAEFVKYQEGKLWYRVCWEERLTEECDPVMGSELHSFEFPIPIDDAGGGEFLPEDKALTFMRWIRKHLEFLKGALAENVYDQ